MKILARELKVPVIALSQLSRRPRAAHHRDKRPILSDLRESGDLEQDADLVAFIYREDYHKNFGDDEIDDAEREELKGIAELIVRKNRNGPIDTVRLIFQEQFASSARCRAPIARSSSARARARRWSTPPRTFESGATKKGRGSSMRSARQVF
jgi:replicative DNA helicase